ncbi:MAG: hypothetical protein ACR2HJ_11680 [Fimbriimonadales bacterium]
MANGKQSLYVINLDGTGLKQITTSPAGDYDPVWSPNGSTISFTRIPGHKKGELRSDGHLWTVRPDGTHLTRLTSGPVFDSVDSGAWSPDSKRIIFHRQGPIPGSYELDLVTKKMTKPIIQMWERSFSPDGKWIAYIRSETEGEDDHRADIWLTRSMRKKGQRLTTFKTSFSGPRWSPNGKDIAFKMEMPPGPGSGDRLCIMSISSHKIRTIAKGHNNMIEGPRWSPNGTSLCFLEAKFSQEPMTNASFRQLYVVSADGTGRRRLTDHWGNDYSPQWTRDGKFIVIQGERGVGTSGVIVVESSGKGGERLLPTGVSAYEVALGP